MTPARLSARDHSPRPLRALLVDDERASMSGLAERLRTAGLFVVLERDARTALANEDSFDAVIANLRMDAMSGAELCERLHAREPELPVILIAAAGDTECFVAGMRAGAQDCLTRPLPWEAVLSSVVQAVERRYEAPSSPRVGLPRKGLAKVASELRNVNERLVISSIREHDHAEEAVRQRAQLDALLENLSDGVIVAEPSGAVRLINDAAHRILGTVDFALAGVAMQPLTRALRGECFQDVELDVVRPGGDARRVLTSGTNVRNDRGEVELAIVVLRDVTELRQLERQREEFTALISHDLRTPLSSVRLLSWSIRNGLSHGAPAAELANVAMRIEENVVRMSGMVDEILDAAGLESGNLALNRARCDLGKLVETIVRRLDDARADRVVVELDDTTHTISADVPRIDRAITNILVNALKYSPEATAVRVEVQRRGDEIEVRVVDRGIGVAPEELARLFDRYYRAPNGKRHAGLGLGLYITKLLVEAHGGRIEVESAPEEGSSFTLVFPDATRDEAARR